MQSTASTDIRLKRAYDPSSPDDGRRVLIDGLWPRGLRKAEAAIDCWLKAIAPSAELRQWFNHDPRRWSEFRARYRSELASHPDLLGELRALARDGPLTLVYGARDQHHNNAVVLREMLTQGGTHRPTPGEPGHAGV
jgi:uncharacterized protein YeaO (DUF488 family)